MAKIKNAVKLDQVMTARLRRMKGGIATGMKEIKNQSLRDLLELTDGTPKGKARIKWLRQQGHPYGRNSAPKIGQPLSGKRRAKGRARNLPIGEISGKLRSAAFSQVDKNLVGRDTTRVTLGFNKKAGKSIHVVLPMGTKKMVSRGLMLPGGKGEIGKRMKMYRGVIYRLYIRPTIKS